ncbi:hypothetical protein [Saccharothrix deserti]|uniref:hypothetical protein n=1 Tax=Saccharothrix deserti TaxID=2593674 RepID=UPI00139188D1|nr:hypothetical protein [Saccharothrix deserti]
MKPIHGPWGAWAGMWMSLSARFAESIEWWRGAHPDVLDDADVARLVPAVERHITEAEPAFSRLLNWSDQRIGSVCQSAQIVAASITNR